MNNSAISRLLDAQPMMVGAQPQIAQPGFEPPQTVAQATVSDAERRRQQIAAREEERQKKARERLANRQSQMERGPETPMESDNPRSGSEPVTPGYEINDLISGAKSQADGEMSSLDRKPMTEWSKSDWGKMLVNMGGGFASAKDGQLSSGIKGATAGVVKGFQDQDERAQKYDDDLRARKQALDDLLMEDELRRRRTGDERAYDRTVRGEERDYRSGERQQDRIHDERLQTKRRQDELADRKDQRTYLDDVRKDERDYAEKAAIAANARSDAKELRAAAAKNSRDYSSDYVKMATELNAERIKYGGEPMKAEELDAIIIPQLQRAYGIGTLGAAPTDVLPENTTLGSGY